MNFTLEQLQANIKQAATYVKGFTKGDADVAIVLGSGLSAFADTAFKHGHVEIDYKEIPNLPITTVTGHKGKLYYGEIQGKRCVCFGGRFHSYEGHPPPTMTILPYLAKELGCKVYVLTNAAGGTIKGMQEGCLMSIVNHASTVRWNPLYGYESIMLKESPDHLDKGFRTLTDMLVFLQSAGNYAYPATIDSSNIYSDQLIGLATAIATEKAFVEKTKFSLKGADRTVELHKGTYVFNSGPYYETHAEIKELMELVPGTVGMSSVPEALCARVLGMHVYGMSLVTNLAAGLSAEPLSHEDVKFVADSVSKAVEELISNLIQRIDLAGLRFVTPLPICSSSSGSLVPHTEGHATLDEVNALWKAIHASKFSAPPKMCVFVPSATFFAKVLPVLLDSSEPCNVLTVGTPVTCGVRDLSAVFAIAIFFGITAFFSLDRTLNAHGKEFDGLIPAAHLVNHTADHGTNIPQLKGAARARGASARGCSIASALHQFIVDARLLVTSSIEAPANSPLITKLIGEMRKATGCKHIQATNGMSILPALFAQSLGLDHFVCSPLFLSTLFGKQGFMKTLLTLSCCGCTARCTARDRLSFVDVPLCLCPCPQRFSLFEGIAQACPKAVGALADAVQHAAGAKIASVLLVDSPQAAQQLEAFARRHGAAVARLHVADMLDGVSAYTLRHASGHVTLLMGVPSILHGASLTDVSVPARICQVLKAERVFVVTDQVRAYGDAAPDRVRFTDVYSIAGVNTLRGENHSQWGPRFPDVGAICNTGLCGALAGDKTFVDAVGVLSCEPTDLLTDETFTLKNGYVNIGSGCLQCLYDLAHGGVKTAALAGDLLDVMEAAARCLG